MTDHQHIALAILGLSDLNEHAIALVRRGFIPVYNFRWSETGDPILRVHFERFAGWPTAPTGQVK